MCRGTRKDLPGSTYVLNSEKTSKRSPRTTLAPLGSNENAVVATYIINLDIVRLVARRFANDKGIGGAVISIAGMVNIMLAAPDMAMIVFSGRSAGVLCIQSVEIRARNQESGRGMLTGELDDEANIHKGNTSATVIATLAAISVLKERRRGRFVIAGGIEPRRAI